MNNSKKPKILFLCTGNSCRSQMAEGLAKQLKGDVFEAYSAGTMPKGIDPIAVKVMNEIDIDISSQISSHVNDLLNIEFAYVVTVCNNAHEICPIFPGNTKTIKKSFDDPPALAVNEKSEEAVINNYRRVRDEIKQFIITFPDSLNSI